MKAAEFIEKLKTLTPPIEIEKFDETENFDDELVNLVMNYDLADFELGEILFAEEAFGDEVSYEVGMFEEKFLIIDRESGEVRVEEDDDNGTILYSCAETSEKFLDALWLGARYFAEQDKKALDSSVLDVCEAQALECAAAAGGENYVAFFQDFLNCYER